MNVISRKKLRQFYESSTERKRHAATFEYWFKLTRLAKWHAFQDAKALFGQTDVVKDTRSGRTAAVFDIGGNKYRVVTQIDYLRQTVFISRVLDHKEYDRNSWKKDI